MVITHSPNVRRRRYLPWIVAGSVIGVLCIYGMRVSYLSNQRLADAMAAADRENPNWRLDDLLAHREQVPDAENSAIVLAKANALLPKDWPNNAPLAAGGSTRSKTAASEAYDRIQELSANERPDTAAASALRTELSAQREALAIARTVGDYWRGRHELVVGRNVIDTSLPETQAVRSVARLLAADAVIRADDGDFDGALDSCRAILGTARSIGDEPMLISALVRTATDLLAVSSSQRVLGQGEASDRALARLQDLLLDEKAQPLLHTAASGERAMLIELIRRVQFGEVPVSAIVGGGISTSMVVSVTGRFGDQRARALEWMNEAVAISRRPTREQCALYAAWDRKIAAFSLSGLNRFTAILPRLLLPAMSSASGAALRSQAELGAMAILIAAERQRIRTGKWPASIKEIDPSILPEAPLDPFTGEPFRMEHRDGQLFIYSIGLNGTDEHGEYDRRRWLQGVLDDVGARAWDLQLRRQPPAQPKPGGPTSLTIERSVKTVH